MAVEKLRNLFWSDFIYYHDRLLGFSEKRLRKASGLVEESVNMDDLKPRIKHTQQMISEARNMLLRIRRRDFIGRSINVDLNMDFDGMIKDVTISVSDLMIMLTQQVHWLEITKPLGFSRKNLTKIVDFLKVPHETRLASRRMMNECLRAIYGSRAPWSSGIPMPVAVCFGYSDYRYLSASKLVCIPPNDATQLCRWSILAHETMHSKLDDFASHLHIINALKSRTDRSKKKSLEILHNMLPDFETAVEKIANLEEDFCRNLKLFTGEAYREAYALLYNDDFYLPKQFLRQQFYEILCDIACTKVAGVADCFVTASSTANHLRNAELDMVDHLLTLSHPPDSIRIQYEYEVLKKLGLDPKSEIMVFLKGQIDKILQIDIHGRGLTEKEKLSRHLFDRYLEIVLAFLPELSKLLDSLLGEEDCRFSQGRWDRIMDYYVRMTKHGPSLEDQNLYPFDFPNLAWLKVADIFTQTFGEGGSYKSFTKARKKEEMKDGFFWNLWKEFITQSTKAFAQK